MGAADVQGGRRHLDAVLRDAADLVEQGSRMQQRLGGDAAAVQAGAAELGVLLDHRHLQAKLPGTDAGDIAAGTAADDDQVEVFLRHRVSQVNAFVDSCRRPGSSAERPTSAPRENGLLSMRSKAPSKAVPKRAG